MHKIGVIGDKDSVMGFKAIGFDVFEAPGAAEAASCLHEAAASGYAVLYIVECTAADIIDAIETYKESRLPAIIPIPGNTGSTGLGMMNVRNSIEKAIGADILFGN
jgi:V/A-type H+-transporting ATPase subunit F